MARGKQSATSQWRDGMHRISQAHQLDRDTRRVVDELADEIERQGNDIEHGDVADRAILRKLDELQRRVKALEERQW